MIIVVSQFSFSPKHLLKTWWVGIWSCFYQTTSQTKYFLTSGEQGFFFFLSSGFSAGRSFFILMLFCHILLLLSNNCTFFVYCTWHCYGSDYFSLILWLIVKYTVCNFVDLHFWLKFYLFFLELTAFTNKNITFSIHTFCMINYCQCWKIINYWY